MFLAIADGLRDIKPPVFFGSGRAPFIKILAVIILLAALTALAVYLYRKFINRQDEEAAAPEKPPHVKAYEALEALKAKGLISAGRIKEYYVELSNIIRHYIEERFIIKAPEMTTEEFLFALRDSGTLTGSHKNLLKEFLTMCDIVKFAKYGPAEEEIRGNFNSAWHFVDETKEPDNIAQEVAAK